MRRSWIVLLFLSFVAALAPNTWEQEAALPSSTGENDPLGFYPDTAEGLHDFLQAVVSAIKKNNAIPGAGSGLNKELNDSLNRRLVVPNTRQWLARVYSPGVARELLNAYRSNSPDLVTELNQPDLDVLTEIKVTRVEFLDLRAATSSRIHFFSGMKTLVPIYTAYLKVPQKPTIRLIRVLFVYLQNGFRAIDGRFGKLDERHRPLCGVPPGLQHLLLHTFGSDLNMRDKRIPSAVPGRFREADTGDESPSVAIFITIGCDGSVLAADYVSGPTNLYQAAAKETKKWHYQKTYINQSPIEVAATVALAVGPEQIEH